MSICKIVFYKQSATVINVLTGGIILKGGNKKLMSATDIIYLFIVSYRQLPVSTFLKRKVNHCNVICFYLGYLKTLTNFDKLANQILCELKHIPLY